MRAHGVVYLFPLAQFAVEFFHLQGTNRDLVELLGVGAVGTFDRAIEFGRARGKDEQAQAALLTGGFELGGELAAAVDLHRTDGKGHAVQQGVEELSSGRGGGASVGLGFADGIGTRPQSAATTGDAAAACAMLRVQALPR